jgi:hypothetical protein
MRPCARAVLALLACAACTDEARGRTDSARAATVAADTSVQAVWTSLRSAALAGDVDRVAAMTQLPLETRGPSDDDPVVPVYRRELRRTFEGVMRQDPGLSATPGTMRALVERTTTLGPRELGPDQARLGAFEFGKTRAGWRWVFAYVEERGR